MKITAILLTIALAHVYAASSAQTITFSGRNLPLKRVFDEIKKQTGYVVFCNKSDLDKTTRVSIAVQHMPLNDFMQVLLQEQPLDFTIEGNTISLSARRIANPFMPSAPSAITAPPAAGKVLAPSGAPLPGATILVKKSGTSVMTDAEGKFSINVSIGDVLVVSYLGYRTSEITITKGNINDPLLIMMLPAVSSLDETVVIAYGTSTKRFNVGSVSTVTAEQIKRQPVTNVLLALQGQVPGLTVNATSGTPGAAVLLQVRGQNSLQNDFTTSIKPYDQPLFIIDGVPFAPQNKNINLMQSLGGGNGSVPYSGISPFNSINPADIESISVLKDADATSIYGTQGANGVVLITTKKGKAGKTQLNITVNTGPNTPSRQVDMLNTKQYMQLRREALTNDRVNLQTANPLSYPELFIYDSTRNTDWFHEFFGKTSNNTDVHMRVSGGTLNTTFLISVGYTHASYNFPGDFSDNRYTLHSGFRHTSNDQKLSIDMGTDFSYDRNTSAAYPSAGRAMIAPPNLPALMDSAGNLNWNYKGANLQAYQMYSYLKQPTDLQTFNLTSTLRVAYLLMRGLHISANMGYSRLSTNEYSASTIASNAPTSGGTGSAYFAANGFQTINIEPQIDYKRTFGRGVLSALVGGTYKKNVATASQTNGFGYTSDAFLGSLAGAASFSVSNSNTLYKYAAMYGRIGYIYDSKYIVNITGRRDGSSNFGPGHQFGIFGSAGLGWIFSEEKGFKRTLPFISYGKLASNYGTNGSDGIAPYQYQAYWMPVTSLPAFQNIRPYQPNNLYNPNYSWDLKKSLNASLDLGFLNDRILLNATWYLNRSSNQLLKYTLPTQTGFANVLQNFAATVQNKGLEFSITSTNIRKKDFSWTSTFNIGLNRNKLVSFPGLDSSSYASTYVVGNSTSVVFLYNYKGINDTTGMFQFYTAKGLPTYSPKLQTIRQGGDRMPLADLQPKFSGGLSNTLTYKGFSMTAFLQFAARTAQNYLYSIYSAATPGTIYNVPLQALDHWQKPGDKTEFQKVSGSSYQPSVQFFNGSTGAYSDMYYVRLKTLSLSYSLPAAWAKRIAMSDCNIYVNAQNVFTITNYKVGDPEMPGNLFTIPTQRTIAAGVSFNF